MWTYAGFWKLVEVAETSLVRAGLTPIGTSS